MAKITVEIDDETHVVVPRKLPPKAHRAAKNAMPCEFRVWLEGGLLHSRFLPEKEQVDPQSVWTAAINAL